MSHFWDTRHMDGDITARNHHCTVRSRYKRIVYKRIWVASLPFQTVWATFCSYWAESAVSYNENALYMTSHVYIQNLKPGACPSGHPRCKIAWLRLSTGKVIALREPWVIAPGCESWVMTPCCRSHGNRVHAVACIGARPCTDEAVSLSVLHQPGGGF